MIFENYYGEYYSLIKTVEEQLELSIYRCLDVFNSSGKKIAKYLSSRIKSPTSIEEKLKRKGFPKGIESAITNLNDIVGFRVVVRFTGDLYAVRDLIKKSDEFKIIEEKDYVLYPKQSGYRSYHIIIETEIEGKKIYSEIQIRTMAMDCWASLEHQLRYKKDIDNIELVNAEMKKCAEHLIMADATMEKTRKLVENNASCT